jgi:hypothetical protein
LGAGGVDLLKQFSNGLVPNKPWESIVDFTIHPSFLGYKAYPRQLTLLKLMFLEIEDMTQYDLDVIEGWRKNFGNRISVGVQPDIWERIDYLKRNGYRRFPHIQAVLGRRASKGWTGGVLGAEQMAYMVSLDNWQDHYGIQPHKDAYGHAVATSLPQAMKFQFADIREAVDSCKYLQPYIATSKDHVIMIRTPADIRHIADLTARRIPIDREIATIRMLAMTSASSSGRGAAAFMVTYDEMAHMLVGTQGPRTSEAVYEAYQPSLQQFGKDSLTYIPSSPFSMVGKFYELYTAGSVPVLEYQEKTGEVTKRVVLAKNLEDDPEQTFDELTADPTMLIIQLPSWELYEDWERASDMLGYSLKRAVMTYDVGMQRLEKRSPSKFKVEYNAQFAEVEDAYLNPDKVDAMFKPFWDGRVLEPKEYGQMDIIYHGHVDPGKSKAHFAMAIGHLENSPEPDEWGNIWPHAIIDYMKVWKAQDYADGIIDFVSVGEELKEVLGQYRSMDVFSFDQWNSAGMIAQLKKMYGHRTTVKEVTFTDKENYKRFEKFQAAINLGWVHSYRDSFFDEDLGGGSLLERELKFLQEKNGKVVKQDFGPVTTKDLADCVMETTVRMLERNLDKWQQMMLGQVPLKPSPGVPAHGFAADRIATTSSVRKGLNSLSESMSSNRRRGMAGYYNPSRGRRPR